MTLRRVLIVGSRWLFASADNLARFRADPERFAPPDGGYCACGMRNVYTALTDPTAWNIAAGRLFLNFDHDIKAQWEAARDEMIRLADGHWPEPRPARSTS